MASAFPTYERIKTPFANEATGATDRKIPDGGNTDNIVSYSKGFPVIYSTPTANGGKYFERKDLNGLGYVATAFQSYLQYGGRINFDSTLSSSINGYPKGAVLTDERTESGKTHVMILRAESDNTTQNPSGLTYEKGVGYKSGNTVVWREVSANKFILDGHVANSSIHVTSDDKTKWNNGLKDTEQYLNKNSTKGEQEVKSTVKFSSVVPTITANLPTAASTAPGSTDEKKISTLKWVHDKISKWWDSITSITIPFTFTKSVKIKRPSDDTGASGWNPSYSCIMADDDFAIARTGYSSKNGPGSLIINRNSGSGSADNWYAGAWLQLYGRDAQYTQDNVKKDACGRFELCAHGKKKNSSNVYVDGTSSLIGWPDGTLTWNGSNIVRSVNGVTAGTGGNVSITASTVGALSTSGGTISGSLKFSNAISSTCIGRNTVDKDGQLWICAEALERDGASIALAGKNHGGTNSGGWFTIGARNSNNNIYLKGYPSGVLTWNDSNIVRSVKVTKEDGATGPEDKTLTAGYDGQITLKASDLNALPKTGGTISGSLTFSNAISSTCIGRNTTNKDGQLWICAEALERDGASIALAGKNHGGTNSGGWFTIGARNSNNNIYLKGYPSGVLTWNGSNIVRSVKVTKEDGATGPEDKTLTAGYDGQITLKASDLNALPKTGGTMNGAIYRSGTLVRNSVDNGNITLCGGKGASSGNDYGSYTGGLLYLYGDKASYKSSGVTTYHYAGFQIIAEGHSDPENPTVANQKRCSLYGNCLGRLSWNGSNIVRSVKVTKEDGATGPEDKTLTAGYDGQITLKASDLNALPKTGGTISGSLTFSNAISNTCISRDSTNKDGQLWICAEKLWSDGASIVLKSKSNATDGGSFALSARKSSTDGKSLVGKPNGYLKWGDDAIVRKITVNGTSYSANETTGEVAFSVSATSNWEFVDTSESISLQAGKIYFVKTTVSQ